jgi:hypothetical protein
MPSSIRKVALTGFLNTSKAAHGRSYLRRFIKALIDKSGDGCYYVMADVRVALGGQSDATASEPQSTPAATPASGKNSKQAQVIAMSQPPGRRHCADIPRDHRWQAHTVRGTFAGAFKKKLGLELSWKKPKGSDRIYLLAAASA